MDNITKKQQHYLEKLHKDILLIMDEVDRICREYQLHYYLMCGSCLGAIRHNGFIPWDDDLDIAMPRNDFERFIALIDKGSVLNNRFYLRWISTEKYYNQDFAKVCLKGTVFQADNGKAEQNAGIFVDVFPLDPCQPFDEKVERKSKLYKHLHSCLYLKGAEKRAMDWKLKHWPRNIFVKIFSNRFIYKIMLYVIKTKNVDSAGCQALFTTPYPIKRQIFPKEWHGEGKRLKFEDRAFVCPSESEKIMRLIYGDKYMELPPKDKRKTHCPIRIVFSDGEEMRFNKTISSISYNDLIG
jgi:lipopolysaccharide cholinephosphotransferase